MKMFIRVASAMLPLLFLSAPLAHAAAHHEISTQTSTAEEIKTLVWQKKEDNLITVTNTGKQVIRLEREVKLLPDDMPLTLNKSQLMPGETLIVYGACPHHLPLQNEVRLTPVSAQGVALTPQTLPLRP